MIFNFSKLSAVAATFPAKGYIDLPTSGSSINGISNVEGWFLDGNGVAKIEVLIDGKSFGTATDNLPRPDVASAFPEYQNPNSGYQYALDTRSLTNGQHLLTVRETGNNGVTTDLISQVNTFNLQNLPVKGTMDSPTSGSIISGVTTVRGWSLDGSGVAKVEVLLDGNSVGNAQLGISRQDVLAVYPDYKNSNSGYQYSLNTNNLADGQHTLAVRETGNNGITTVLSSQQVIVQNLAPKGVIDSPTPGSVVNGVINVRGWSLDGSGVAKVEVLIDGNSVGQANLGISRPDVAGVYPTYQNANSGYQYSLDTRNVSNGQHTMSVREIGNNGVTTVINSQQVNVQNLPAIGSLDSPTPSSTINGVINVRGWSLDGSGVAKVEVLVDGNSVGQASLGISRPDVAGVYSAYQNAISGYQYSLDTRNISNGQHNLVVRETGNNGVTTVINSQQVNVQNLPVIGSLDSPTPSSTINGVINVRGWSLDGSGVAKVEVLVDGNSIGQAGLGISRPDVAGAYSAYQNANSGYQYSLDTRNISNGQHTLVVRETGNNGVATVLNSQQVNIQNLPPKGSIDSPTPGSTINGVINLRGWSLDGSGVAKVEVSVDGNSVGQASLGISRPDVAGVYPGYQNANSGYQFTLNTKVLTNGQHSLLVRETGNNGVSMVIGSQNVNVQNLPAIGSIDTPLNLSTIKGTAAVQGWFLDGSDVSKVEVLVDGVNLGQAQLGGSRLDVVAAFPNYQNVNSGYNFTFDTQQFADGQHVLTVKETGTNGTTTVLNNTILISNGDPYSLIDLRKPATITAADIVKFINHYKPYDPNNPSMPNRLLNDAQAFIDAQNKYGVNAQYLVAHAIWETGWGGSQIYAYKHNLFGYGAYDTNPFNGAYYFPTDADSINFEAYIVRKNYLDPTGKYYSGSNLKGMNVYYASDQNWVNGIANLMEEIKPFNYSTDYAYYYQTAILPASSTVPPSYGTAIPAGQPTP
ncbi:MAG: Ig-like domain-containing protein [Bacillota bacterium]|nr:Ig-like domain-containing protein [Bacillota bacterium]